jgi:hypothetical protein
MSPRPRAVLQILVLGGVGVFLLWLFPRALAAAELAAREAVYLWWLVLLAALGVWLVWGASRKRK